MACGFELAGRVPRQQVRKTVTVVFSDLVGSTDVGERLDPEALREVLAEYFTRMRAAVERHGGVVERLLGDAVIAVFGLPVAHEDDALRAVRAAVDMRTALIQVNEGLPRGLDLQISARTGVNTGEVLIADDALSGVMTGDVVGDVVNVAARLEGAAGTGEILVGELTYRLVREFVETDRLNLRLKGKRDAVPAHRLLSVSTTRAAGRRLVAPLVGRQAEYDALLATFERSRADHSAQLTTVMGTAGSGKSRLVREATAKLGDEAAVVTGRCLPYGEIAMLPIAEIVTQLVGLELGSSGSDVQDALRGLLSLPDQLDESVRLRAARIAGVAGLGPLAGAVEDAAPDLAALLVAAADRRPVVVVVEDLHWASESLLDLLEAVARGCSAAPVMLLCTARPELLEAYPTWSSSLPDATVLELAALDERDSRELIDELLGPGDAARAVANSVANVAEGNPFVVEAALAMLIDDGLLIRRDGAWHLDADLGELRIPPSVEAILAARLDLLPAEERQTAELAAVIGKQFTRTELAALDGGELTGLDAALDGLWARQLIDVEEHQPDGLRFHHILVRDAVYAATPKRRRGNLHAGFAEIVAAAPGGGFGGQFSEIVGEHLERAYHFKRELGASAEEVRDLGSSAASRLAEAAERATGSSDHAAAERLQVRALGVVDEDDPLHPTLLIDLADVRYDLGWHLKVREHLVKAAAAADRVGSHETQLRAALSLARFDVVCGDRDPLGAIGEMQGLAERLEATADDRAVVRAWMAICHVAYFADRHDTAYAMAQRAAEHARRLGGSELPYCLVGLCEVALRGSLPVPAVGDECRSALAEAQPGTLHAAWLEMKLGSVDAMRGSFASARAHINAGLAVAEAQRALAWIGDGHYKLGKCEALAGDYEAAAYSFGRTREVWGRLAEPSEATLAALQAVCWVRLGDFEQARDGVDYARPRELDSESKIAWRVASAELESAVGAPDLAMRHAVEAVDIAERVDDLLALGDALSTLGAVRLAHGDRLEGVAALERAVTAYEAKGVVPAAASVRSRLWAATSAT